MFKTITTAAILGLLASTALADSWTLDGANSKLSFGSVKSSDIGEAHSIGGLEGTVSRDGNVALTIALGTLQTNIDIRNERIQEHVFQGAPSADLLAEVDMAALEGLSVGDTTTSLVEGTLMFLGEEVYVDIPVLVARLSDDRVLITSDEVVFISTEELGINAGIDKLMELASLPSITRAVPISLRFMFTASDENA